VGPGAARERETLEAASPGSTSTVFRHDGLSALDLAAAARLDAGPGAGLPQPGREMEPAYVRPAQAEEKVRHRISGLTPPTIRELRPADLPTVDEMEHRLFSDPWPQHFFLTAMEEPAAVLRVAERKGVATLQPPYAELQNLATAPEQQRSGVARALMAEFFDTCRARDVREIGLEVRVSNSAAQALYRGLGFRLMGLRRGYYKAPEEDALLMGRRLG
jgi:ribosomal-protein-alanine N-acetyltransferase